MINPNIADNEGIYRSQIREFFEGKFGAFRDEGHYLTELKTFRSSYASGEENGYTTVGNYGSFDNVYATKRDVIIGFIEYWLTGGYQKYNRNNKYIINDEFAICDKTDFTTIYDDIIDSFDATELKQIATQEFAHEIVRPNWLTISTGNTQTTLSKSSSWSGTSYEWSGDGITWTTLSTTSVIILANSKLYLRGNNNTLNNPTFTSGSDGIIRFNFSNDGNVTISGSIQSLVYGDDTENIYIAYDGCFASCFSGVTKILNTPELPATQLKPYCYQSMFYGCTALGNISELPATTLAERCYMSMFEGCTGIYSINPLPATTLAPYCYEQMFYGCTHINFQPDVMYLPATKMERGCYLKMFYMCSGIVQAPMLPAYNLARECYMGMFGKCTYLKYAPELPALELKEQCYDTMFIDCSSLEIAPELPAKFLPQQAYSWMFCRCTSLRYIKMLFTELTEGDNYALSDYGVVMDDPTIWHNSIRGILYNNRLTNGTIILNTDYLESLSNVQLIIKNNVGDDGNIKNSPLRFVPSQWSLYGSRNYLHFKPVPSTTSVTNCQSWKLIINKATFNNGNPTYSNGTFLELVIHGSQEGYDIEYDRSTNTFEYYEGLIIEPDEDTGEISLTFGSEGIYIKENYYNYENRNIEYDTRWYNRPTNGDGHQHFRFVPQDNSTDTQYIDMFGDLRSLYYPKETFDTYNELPNNSYHNYWYDWSTYSFMFMFNTYLRHVYASVNVKEFTANMFTAAFTGCTNLIYLPNFGTDPLIPLNYATFNSTFSGCTSLEYIPELPYLTYSDEDYTCGGTTNGYEISGTFYTEPTGCYGGMFAGCCNIKFLPNIFPLRSLCRGVYGDMFNMWSDTESLRKSEFKKMPELIGVTGVNDCIKAMFAHCDLKEVQCIPLTTIVDDNKSIFGTFRGMFVYNQNLKTAMHTLPLTTLQTNTYIGMFEDCRKLAVAPKIQAKTVNTDCMKWSFLRCYNLKYTNTSVTSTTTTPFNNTGNNTLKEYSTNWENEDKKGMLWIDNGQFTGVSRGYYKAALLSYSINPDNPNSNTYEFDGSYWIYIMTRKFADGKTYYVWKKYQSNEGIGMNINTGNTNHDLYLVTQECIIPGCVITSISQATSTTNPTPLYTIIGYMSVDFLSNINDARSGVEADESEEDQYFDEGVWVNTNLGNKVYCKVLLSVTE